MLPMGNDRDQDALLSLSAFHTSKSKKTNLKTIRHNSMMDNGMKSNSNS